MFAPADNGDCWFKNAQLDATFLDPANMNLTTHQQTFICDQTLQIGRGAFDPLHHLITLDLSYNFMTSCDTHDWTFEGVQDTLRSLNLGFNLLSYIPTTNTSNETARSACELSRVAEKTKLRRVPVQ